MERLDILKALQAVSGVTEAYHCSTFRVYRQTSDGRTIGATVTILDAGPRERRTRYSCQGQVDKDHGGQKFAGNPMESVEGALYLLEMKLR